MEQTERTPEDAARRLEELRIAAQPLLKYLCEKWHPHVTVIITPTSVELLSGELHLPRIYEFVKD